MSGIAFSFCDDEEMAYLRDIQRLIKKQIPVETDHAWSIKGAEVPLVSGHIHNNSRPAAPKKKAKPQQQRNQPPQGQSQSSSSRSSSGESANSPKPKGKGRPWHKKGPRKPNPISY
jgi:ATP-dependent RNA helicase RhlE